MPRLRQVSKTDATPEIKAAYEKFFGDRDPVKEPGTATGTPGNWWTVHALDPAIFQHCLDGFALTIGEKATLTPVFRELAIVRSGFNVGSQFVFSQHCKSCRALGMLDDKIAAIPGWEVSSLFAPAERAVLAYTDALVLGGGRVEDALFAALKEHLTDEQILELTYITCMYDMHATMCRALHLEYDNVPEPVTEIPAPEGSGDILQAVDE